MTEFSFPTEIKMIDCLNQRKKQILYFLQLTEVLQTERTTIVVFNSFMAVVAGRKKNVFTMLLDWCSPLTKGNSFPCSDSPSNPQDTRIPRFSAEEHPCKQQIPAQATPAALITPRTRRGNANTRISSFLSLLN